MKITTSLTTRTSLFLLLSLAGCSGGGELESLDAAGSPDAAPLRPAARAAASNAEPTSLPVYIVTRSRVEEGAAQRLAKALRLGKNGLDATGAIVDGDGAIRYLDAARFHRLPMKDGNAAPPATPDENGNPVVTSRASLDVDALRALRPLAQKDALRRAEAALAAAGLRVDGEASLSHATFEAVDLSGNEVVTAPLDTQVSYRFSLEGLRLMGPGAKVKVVFDADGVATQVIYARRELARGETVAIVPPSRSEQLCADAFGGGDDLEVEAELVYYAPPLSIKAAKIVPHYVCSGRRVAQGRATPLRSKLVPAVVDAPRAALSVTASGPDVLARAVVEGGTAPYTFHWTSASGSLDRSLADASALRYTVYRKTHERARESVSLVVRDSNGLTARVAHTVEVTPEVAPRAPAKRGDPDPDSSVGTEWISECGDLDEAGANAEGFVDRFSSADVEIKFDEGEEDAKAAHFRDPAFGGKDDRWVEKTDLVFYAGHADGSGFSFCNDDDEWVDYDEARWGTGLEWLTIAACGPLQTEANDERWDERWGPAFRGLHLLMGYANTSFDTDEEGEKFANRMLKSSPLTIRQAWIQTAKDAQPDDVDYAVMGAYGSGESMPNYDDHFWGVGSTGPDLTGSAIKGFWRVKGSS